MSFLTGIFGKVAADIIWRIASKLFSFIAEGLARWQKSLKDKEEYQKKNEDVRKDMEESVNQSEEDKWRAIEKANRNSF